MRLVAFNVDQLQFMFSGLANQADRWRPRPRKNQPGSSVGDSFSREFDALAKKIGTVLHQAEHSIMTNIAITGQLPVATDVPERGPPPAPPEPPRLITLSVSELRTLWMAVLGEAANIERALEREVRKGRKTKDEADYIRGERRRVKHCRRLAEQIDRLYERARKRTAVNVALE